MLSEVDFPQKIRPFWLEDFLELKIYLGEALQELNRKALVSRPETNEERSDIMRRER